MLTLNPETDGEETTQRHTETQSQGMEAETSVMLLQAGEQQGLRADTWIP